MSSFLGSSIKYPLVIKDGKPMFVSGRDNIKQNIAHILGTSAGGRFYLPNYQSRLDELLFNPNDDVLQNMLQLFIKKAIETWEPRVQYRSVSFSVDNDTILCSVSYAILQVNTNDSYVFPFYKKLIY